MSRHKKYAYEEQFVDLPYLFKSVYVYMHVCVCKLISLRARKTYVSM